MPIFPTPEPWKTTSLSTGPLLGGTYNCTITTCISASTIYEYRAYSVIDGVPHYGNILTGCTLAIPTAVPTVCTGVMFSANTQGGCVCTNKMCDDNNAPIAEYGILYTQQPSVSCDACLRYDKVPTWVCKQSTCATIPDDTTYAGLITAMAANTTTYFRAFAKNSVGVGYGNVCNFITCDIPQPPLTITAIACTDCLGLYLAGAYCLVCCDGNNYATIIIGSPIQECTIFSCTLNSVPAGSYYIDYSGVELYCCDGWYQVSTSMNWDINSSCYMFDSCCTTCFDYNANICGCIYGSA